MAWDNALNKVISDLISVGPTEESKLPFFANTDWSDTAESADEVTIVSLGAAVIKTFVPGTDITFGTGAASNAVLKCDQYKYFADTVFDTVKMISAYAIKYAEEALKKLALEADNYVMSLATKANFPTNWYSAAADAVQDVNSANIIEVIQELNEKLDLQNVPSEGRFITVDPSLYKVIKRGVKAAGLSLERSGDAFFEGKAYMVDGMNIILTNQMTGDTTNGWYCLYGNKDSIAAAVKPGAVESVRHEASFGDGIKSLLQFGAKVIQEKSGGAAFLRAIAEA
jgi:hypothetical protein